MTTEADCRESSIRPGGQRPAEPASGAQVFGRVRTACAAGSHGGGAGFGGAGARSGAGSGAGSGFGSASGDEVRSGSGAGSRAGARSGAGVDPGVNALPTPSITLLIARRLVDPAMMNSAE